MTALSAIALATAGAGLLIAPAAAGQPQSGTTYYVSAAGQ